jgi:hypothetical protein
MIQVIEKSWNGHCKYCSIHDLLRDVAIHEAKEDKFFTVLLKKEDYRQRAASVARRASLLYTSSTEYSIGSPSMRSLLCFGQTVLNYKGFRLLKVITIEGVDLANVEITCEVWLEGLIHLRYLGFRYCEELPYGLGSVSFNSLKNLETLDFKGTHLSKLNPSVWQIPTLRRGFSIRNTRAVKVGSPSKSANLTMGELSKDS